MTKSVSNVFKSFDIFGQPLRLQVRGLSTFVTLPGAIITFLIYIVSIGYAQQKFMIMWHYEDTLYQTKTTLTPVED